MAMLKTISTGSKGNSYSVVTDSGILILDLGVSDRIIKRAIDYRVSDITACLITHCHL